jgi:tetratricopeptide (TPR) repeat protein
MVSNELLKMGNTAYASGQTDKALDLYVEGSRIMPTNAETYFNIGGIYLMKRNLPLARENWQKTLNLNPNHVEAKNWLAKTAGAK